MKRACTIFFLALAAALLLNACAEPAAPSAAVPGPSRAYALEKLNEVSDMVLNRQVVPEDYLRYLDETSSEKVAEYNVGLANAKTVVVCYAKGWADTFRDMNAFPEDAPGYDAAFAGYGRYLEEGDNYFRFIEEFSSALLYPNHYDFTLFEAFAGYPAGSETGGSGGLWASGYYLDKAPMDELTAAASDLLDQLDAVRAGWMQDD